MAKHAFLSASASERWLKCPPSAKLCAQEEDKGSPFAQQGTDAHELCQYLLEKALGRDSRDPTEDLTWYNAEMQEAAEGYVSYQFMMYGMGNVPPQILKEQAAKMLADENQARRLEESVEDRKVLAALRERVTLTAKKISLDKFRELK